MAYIPPRTFFRIHFKKHFCEINHERLKIISARPSKEWVT
jgi:hypothetical protein